MPHAANVRQRTAAVAGIWHAAAMNDPHTGLWPAFQRLANEHPDCNGVKLTLELQRWFISVQQQQFLQRLSAMVPSLGELAPT